MGGSGGLGRIFYWGLECNNFYKGWNVVDGMADDWMAYHDVDFPETASDSPMFESWPSGKVTSRGEFEKTMAIEHVRRPLGGVSLLTRAGLAIKRACYSVLPESYFARRMGFE